MGMLFKCFHSFQRPIFLVSSNRVL